MNAPYAYLKHFFSSQCPYRIRHNFVSLIFKCSNLKVLLNLIPEFHNPWDISSLQYMISLLLPAPVLKNAEKIED
jgi:hypothetical protein